MEESIKTDFQEYINRTLGLEDRDPKIYSPLTLAYLGDCVFDLIIKTMLLSDGNRQVHKLHMEASSYVQASAQSKMMRAMQPLLTEEEHAVYRRGRNAKSVSPARHQSITDYRRATGFEALIGYLYLTKQYERLTELVKAGLDSLEEADEARE